MKTLYFNIFNFLNKSKKTTVPLVSLGPTFPCVIFACAPALLSYKFFKVIAVSIISHQYAFLVTNIGQRFGSPGCGTQESVVYSDKDVVNMISSRNDFWPKIYSIFFRKVLSIVRSFIRIFAKKWHNVGLVKLFAVILLSYDFGLIIGACR